MGLMPAGAKNPFTRIDAQSVIGALKATGSRDPDVLHAQKQELLAPYNHLKLLGIIGMVCGAFFTITFILAIFGIPCLIASWWCWNFGKKNIEAVESGYAQYIATLQPAVATV